MEQSPWITIWTKPRETIANIVAENPKQGIWGLAWIYGVLSLLNGMQSFALGSAVHFLILIVTAIILAPFWGMLLFGIWSYVVFLIGKLLKGQGTFQTVRASFAWSCVPLSINIVLWFFALLLFGSQMFDMMEPSDGPMLVLFFIMVIKIAVVIWSLVIYINGLAEVQKFSIPRAVANIILSWLVIAIAIGIIWTLLSTIVQVQTKVVSCFVHSL